MLIIPVLSTLLTAFLVNSMDTSILDPKGASVAAGIDSICAIQSVHGVEVGGKLFCWSDNEDHIQLQEEDEIAGGPLTTCGITIDQSVYCWGLGNGYVPGLFIQITYSDNYGCGIRVDGTIFCWGGSRVVNSLPRYSDSLKFSQIDCSSLHCCALDVDGYAHCFGISGNGETVVPFDDNIDVEFDDDEEEIDKRRRIDPTKPKKKFRQIAVGQFYSCAITLSNDLHCWGEHKQIKKFLPRYEKGPFKQVSTGDLGMCAIYEDGDADSMPVPPNSMKCWGLAAIHIGPSEREMEWDQIAIGSGGICGVSMDSELKCWGRSVYSKLPEIFVA